MGSAHIRSNGVGRAQVQAGGVGHVSLSAGSPDVARYVPDGKWDVVIYDSPGGRTGAARSNNPGLQEVLLSGKMGTVVHEYTQLVANSYRSMLGARSSGKANGLLSTVEATVWPYWGYSKDRWVGEVKVGSASTPYGAADEFGRKNPDAKQHGSTTDGSHELRTALYMHLPYPL